jgi:ribosomal-protein-alanine N-acetyltransferase
MSSKVVPDGNKVIITTSRLVLRGAREEDVESLYEVFSHPKVMKYWYFFYCAMRFNTEVGRRSELPHPSVERTTKWVASMIADFQNGTTDFVVTLKETGRPIGKMGIWAQDEIGYLLNASYWRKGLALEALNALLPYFFREKGFNVITADTDPDNTASIALLKKVGFEITGFEKRTFQIGDTWVDSCYLRLRKDKWESSAKLCDSTEKDPSLA